MRLIDADELNERFESSCTTECACCPYSGDNCGLVHEADTVNAIPIPENATNGDMIKALFPNMPRQMFWSIETEMNLASHYDWWNAPYNVERVRNK